ncbi:hypothetical protein BC828DRAFT_360706 [Blastocladiella britannica]|nr:hypothetical protein BC828DRAFT_360706 [Blastocladiella britannica]
MMAMHRHPSAAVLMRRMQQQRQRSPVYHRRTVTSTPAPAPALPTSGSLAAAFAPHHLADDSLDDHHPSSSHHLASPLSSPSSSSSSSSPSSKRRRSPRVELPPPPVALVPPRSSRPVATSTESPNTPPPPVQQEHQTHGTTPQSLLSDPSHFYESRVLAQYALHPPTRVTLRQLVHIGRHLSAAKLVKSANYLRTELPIRLAHRLRDFQTALPYGAVCNPHLAAVYATYWESFSRLRALPPVETLADNDVLCATLEAELDRHRAAIPRLALGLLECHARGILAADAVDAFMAEMLRSRIGRRVLAQQHLALTRQLSAANDAAADPFRTIGVVATDVSPTAAVAHASRVATALLLNTFPWLPVAPTVEIVADKSAEDVRFPYIPDHLEYIVLELLKNAMVATVRQAATKSSNNDNDSDTDDLAEAIKARPIVVTIAAGPDDVVVRVSDMGGGIPRAVRPHLFSFVRRSSPDATLTPIDPEEVHEAAVDGAGIDAEAERVGAVVVAAADDAAAHPRADQSNRGENESDLTTGATALANMVWTTARARSLPTVPLRHLGLGAPLARVFAEYWGGELDVAVVDGWGSDAYLRVPRRGTQVENVKATAIAVDAK